MQNILRSSMSIAAKPSPVEHIASPSSPASSASSSRRQSFRGHDRAMSGITAETKTGPPRSNRFSVSFPVTPSNSTSPVRKAQSPVREAPSVVPESLALLTGPSDGNFLTAIATQERRVLELKEELAKAEADLHKLKKQWAQYEAQKKRDDAKSVTKLQPLQTFLPATEAEEDSDGSNAWMQQEMEKRKALLNSNKSSNRTVFSGSRHTKTLSLLSPVNRTPAPTAVPTASTQQPPMRPPRKESLSETAQRSRDTDKPPRKPAQMGRATTLPDLAVNGAETLIPERNMEENGVGKDMLVETGKKVATGLRDGLWTFLEDLRQVTVGEEATRIEPPPRRQSSTQSLRSATKQRSKTSLLPSSRGSSTNSKTSTDTKRRSPTRPNHNKAATMCLISAPTLADPSFWTEFSPPVAQRETPAKVKKATSPAARHDKSASTVSPRASSDNETWETWDESSPQGSRASSAVSESTTHPSTVSNAASPRTSTEVPKKAGSNLNPSNKTPESSSKIPWPTLSNLGPKALRRTASHLIAELDKTITPSPTREGNEQDDYLGWGAEAAASALPTGEQRD